MAEPLKEQIYQLYDQLRPWGKAAVAGGLVLALSIPYKYYITKARNTPIKKIIRKHYDLAEKNYRRLHIFRDMTKIFSKGSMESHLNTEQRAAPRAFALQVIKTAGIGKHTREEVVNIGNDDLRAISLYLDSKHYFTGFKPTRVDVALFGALAQIIFAPYELPQKTLIENELTNLKEYGDRIKG